VAGSMRPRGGKTGPPRLVDHLFFQLETSASYLDVDEELRARDWRRQDLVVPEEPIVDRRPPRARHEVRPTLMPLPSSRTSLSGEMLNVSAPRPARHRSVIRR